MPSNKHQDAKPQVKKKPSVFIGCSTEALPVAHTVQRILSAHALVNIWNQGLLRPGSYIIDEITCQAPDFDFALLLFSADDIIRTRKKTMLAARDNTILEAGIFIATLGRFRTFIMVPDLPKLKLPSDFGGLMHVPYNNKVEPQFAEGTLTANIYPIIMSINEQKERKKKAKESRPTFERHISNSMVFLMRLLERHPRRSLDFLGKELAKYLGNNELVDNKFCRDAAGYVMSFLSYINLVRTQAIRTIEYELTEEGLVFIADPHVRKTFDTAFAVDVG